LRGKNKQFFHWRNMLPKTNSGLLQTAAGYWLLAIGYWLVVVANNMQISQYILFSRKKSQQQEAGRQGQFIE
jgi:hypothetical protein